MKRIKNNSITILTNKVTLIMILVTFISVLGSTYAYFYFAVDDNTTLTGKMATVNLDLEVTSVLPTKESTGVMVPQKSVSGSNLSALSSALKKGCVDDNKNIVCQVYRIKIKNDGGSATEIIDGEVSFYANQELTQNAATVMPNLKWKLISSFDQNNNNNSVLGNNIDNAASSTPAKFVQNVELETNDIETYYMIIWFNEINDDQIDESNTYYGKIEFLSSNGTGVTGTFK
ncbi:MAG: hypothetical protein VZS44_04620 [Bacilli bacterium]|nr:hypothetical protein [Bacilli bacterium]